MCDAIRSASRVYVYVSCVLACKRHEPLLFVVVHGCETPERFFVLLVNGGVSMYELRINV